MATRKVNRETGPRNDPNDAAKLTAVRRHNFMLHAAILNLCPPLKQVTDALRKGDTKRAVRVLDLATTSLERTVRKVAEENGYKPPRKGGGR